MLFYRLLLTGPEDTPYSGGAFLFDMFFPPNYPAIPPKVSTGMLDRSQQCCISGEASSRFITQQCPLPGGLQLRNIAAYGRWYAKQSMCMCWLLMTACWCGLPAGADHHHWRRIG